MDSASRADSVSAYAIGVGIGLVALQVTWLIANRLGTLLWGIPVGPTVGIVTAMVVGIVVSVIAGRRLARSVTTRPERVEREMVP